ncbi:MAG TPA: hypothetical protein VFE47_18215 [Tepidisphaeraceae bacterium]|nr:hypothetical protein [Tepidisphaeraceae bacterium]
MRQTLLKLEFAVLVLVAASIAPAVPPPLPDLSTFPNSLGVNIHFTDPKPGEMEQIYGAGFRWVRMDFSWAGIEHARGEYDFSAYDRLIASLDQHHMHAIFILDYGNRHYDKGLSPYTDEGRAAFAKWAAASVHHFKGHGVFWEMWNEPNGSFWKPARNVDDYIKLALVVGKAIEEAEPGEIYIGPATSTIDMPFLEACFKAGCLQYWSAVSVHPYRQTDPETVADEYRKLRKLIAQYAPKGRQIPIISGEWGYSSVWKDFNEERQAKYLPREILTNIANDVPLSIWYDWHEDGKDPKEPEHHFGIVKPDGVNHPGEVYDPKKAYWAVGGMNAHLGGFRFSKRLWTGNAEDYVLVFDDGKAQRLVAWTTDPKHTGVDLPTISGSDTSIFGYLDDGGRSFDRPFATFEDGLVVSDSPTYYEPRKPNELLQLAAAWTRAPMDVTMAGPCIAHIPTTVRNPLDRPITLYLGKASKVLKPGESTTIAPDIEVGREGIVPAMIDLDVEGLGKVWQRSSIIVANPLKVTLLPRTGFSQYARIENPGGDAVRAIAHLTDGLVPEHICSTARVEINAGETQATIEFSISKGEMNSRAASVVLVDKTTSIHLVNTKPVDARDLASFSEKPAQAWTVVADGDAKVASDQSLAEAVPADGPVAPNLPAVRLSYRFDKGWKFVRVAPAAKTDAKIEGKPTSLGLWVHGDASGNIGRMRFTDSTGQTFQPDGGRINWNGWRYIEFPMTGRDTAHWGGKDDGTVHYPVKIDSLFLLDNASRQPTSGEIYLSTPTIIYEK